METTQTESDVPPKRKFAAWQLPVGLVFSVGAFVFGGFMAVPAVLAVIPPLRRFWLMAVALFVGVLGIRGLALAGVNPVLDYARDTAISQMEITIGAEVSYESFEGDALYGELKFTGLKSEVEPVNGGIEIDQLDIFAGYALLIRPEGYEVTGSELSIAADVSGGKLESYLDGLDTPGGIDVTLDIEGGHISLPGEGTSAEIELAGVSGTVDADGWQFRVAMSSADLTIKGQTHNLTFEGGLMLTEQNGDFSVEADLMVAEPALGRGVARGELTPGGPGSIMFTLDWLDLNPLWARYRKIDQYFGTARGQVAISGDLSRLGFDFKLHVRDYEYFHHTLMGIGDAERFTIPEADISGRIDVIEGETWVFKGVTVQADEATLATDPKMTASGRGSVVLDGTFPSLSGRLDATVTSGQINQHITWSQTAPDSLQDVTPNLVLVGEQFSGLELEWTVDVQEVALNAEPLTGTLAGRLNGTFSKQPGKTLGELRAEGELAISDGRVEFLAMQGDVTGNVVFNLNAPTYQAGVRGQIDGSVGDTTLDIEITGSVMRPGFIFKGVTMHPDTLGKKILEHSEEPLSAAGRVERQEQLVRLCGPGAAATGNPFTARESRKVFFTFKP